MNTQTPFASTRGELRIFRDLDELSRAAADFFADVANASVKRAGEFFVALSGGSTPQRLYEIIGSDYHGRIPWIQTQLFWSDERCVPPDDPQSNYRMATEALSAVAISPMIGIGAAVTRRPLPHHRAYGSVHGGSSRLR